MAVTSIFGTLDVRWLILYKKFFFFISRELQCFHHGFKLIAFLNSTTFGSSVRIVIQGFKRSKNRYLWFIQAERLGNWTVRTVELRPNSGLTTNRQQMKSFDLVVNKSLVSLIKILNASSNFKSYPFLTSVRFLLLAIKNWHIVPSHFCLVAKLAVYRRLDICIFANLVI